MEIKEKIFNQIYSSLKDKIYRLCLGFTGNHFDANDLFQEILILIWNNLQNFRNESSINTWVYKIATNRAILFINQKKRVDKLHLDVNLEAIKIKTTPVDSEVQDHKEYKIKQLYFLISTLKEMDKIIISLLLEGCSYNEISEITGLSLSHVGVKINRIKKLLNAKISKP